jgi:hypothetical protein
MHHSVTLLLSRTRVAESPRFDQASNGALSQTVYTNRASSATARSPALDQCPRADAPANLARELWENPRRIAESRQVWAE